MFKIHIPKPIQIVIDDVGWWCGTDGHDIEQPFRTGICRNHVIEDYFAIFKLGKDLGVRPQAAMILCEWDRGNILRNLPDSTWMGKNWDNSDVSIERLEQASDCLNTNRDYFEFTLHGIGHEFWHDEKMLRAEWYDINGKMRPAVHRHLDCYAKLMEMNDLGGFPVSFVPCAFLYHFGSKTDNLAEILYQYGVRFISSPFERMVFSHKTETELFGFDHGLITINRGADLKRWNALGEYPGEDDKLIHPIAGLHWPQILHKNSLRNFEVVDRWVDFFKQHDRMLEWTLARDIRSFSTQLAHWSLSEVTVLNKSAIIDISGVRRLSWQEFSDQLIIKICSSKQLCFFSLDANITNCTKFEEDKSITYTLSISAKDIKAESIKLDWSTSEV